MRHLDDSDAVWGRLAHVPGYDLATGLRNVGGSQAALLRVLGRFVDMYAAGVPALQQTPADPQGQTWREAAHSLRGACATLGAKALEQDLLSFERALQQGVAAQTLATEARTLHAQVQACVAALARALHG